MSRFQKIFLATALVVVGFGVARFLGQPVLPTEVLASHALLPSAVSLGVSLPLSTTGAMPAAAQVRLLPDSPATQAGAPAVGSASAAPAPRGLENMIGPVAAVNEKTDNSTMPRSFDFGPTASAPIGDSGGPRAHLRNEAPRAVGIDPQSPAAIHRLPTDDKTASDPYKVADAKTAGPASWTAPRLLNTGLTESVPASPPAVPASYAPAQSLSAAVDKQVSPPPWPAPEETPDPRTHIVVDGDSLERLASRYLSDPQRGREIYELNRDKLSSPDLLPIGVELKIPDRVALSSWTRNCFPPNTTNVPPNNEIGQANMIPARPTASPQGIVPRAQLAPPVMVQ